MLPLLKAMHAETGGVGPVVPMGLQKLWAVELRNALEEAKVKRPELYAMTDASKRVCFHDLRASGLTWMAIRGDSPVHIKLVAGHTAFEMTSNTSRPRARSTCYPARRCSLSCPRTCSSRPSRAEFARPGIEADSGQPEITIQHQSGCRSHPDAVGAGNPWRGGLLMGS